MEIMVIIWKKEKIKMEVKNGNRTERKTNREN